MVTIAWGIHLFPSRTQKLSPTSPMVLGWKRPGRVGSRQIKRERARRCPFFLSRGREVASRRAHNPETAGSNPAPAMKKQKGQHNVLPFLLVCKSRGQDENPVRLPELPQGQAPKARRSSGERGIQRREAPWESCPRRIFFLRTPIIVLW